MRRFIMMIPLLLFCASANASENTGFWKTELEIGFVQTGGNTQTQTVNAKGKAVGEDDKFRTTIEGTALSAKDGKVTTTEKYSASIQEDWKLSELDYLFGRVGFDTDRFGGFKRRLRETLGYGRDLIKEETLHWKAEIGVGIRQTTFTTNQKKNEAIGRASTAIKWNINDAATFTQELSTEGGKEGFVSNSVSALQQKLNSRLATKLSFSAQHTSKVPAGTKKLNTETAITLVWSY